MKKTLFLIFLFICFFQGYSQINEWMENVVLIQSKDKSHSGSGFLYNTGKNIYLVTARHVLVGTQKTLLFDEITFHSYPKDSEKEIAIEYSINLRKAFINNKARYGNRYDIIAVQLGATKPGMVNYYDYVSRTGGRSNINIFSINDCILSLDSINVGEDIFMIGYPKSLEVTQHNNFNFNRPLARKGIVSGKDYQHTTILVDCPSFGGNSGGPVLMKKHDQIFMIGLVSSYVPYIDYWINPVTKITNRETSNSGLTVVVPFYRIIRDLYEEQLWQ
jgi:hypothetical protein